MSELANPAKRRLTLTNAPTPQQRTSALSRELRELDETAAAQRFGLERGERLVKSTISLCAVCLAHVPALIFVRDGRVFLRAECAQHGRLDGLVENDVRYYFTSSKDRSGRIYDQSRIFSIADYALPGVDSCCEGGACDGSDQMANKTCTVLVEVTNACNIACKVCYSDARGDRVIPRPELERHIDQLARKKGGLDSVQLTGGEAMLHPEFWQLVQFLYEHPLVKKIYLPTNGLLLANFATAERMRAFRDKLLVLLQFDGLSSESDRSLRNATPGQIRRRVIEHFAKLDVFMQLTMTLARGVNDSEVGAVVDLAAAHSHVKVVALQPATYSGRYELATDALERLTLSDMVKAVARQSRLRVGEPDFVPIPCSHPNCGWITLFLRRFGLVKNVIRFVDLPKVMDAVSYKTQLSTSELREAVGSQERNPARRALGQLARRLVRSEDMFTIAIKPFMDRFAYDQDRIENCCHHLLDTRGVPTSFCEYNARLRAGDPWDRFPTLEAVPSQLS
ncbi:MAG TPA: radical SAM protein [Polyangiaceae bacterium]|nr:radical SAM protein [Polyangiaceae bacterium]